MNLRVKVLIIFLVALIFSGQDLAYGQSAGLDPGAIQRNTQKQFQDYKKEKKLIDAVSDKAYKKDVIEGEDLRDKQIGEYIYNPKFHLDKIVLEGNSIYNDKTLLKLAKTLIGKDIYLNDVLNYTVDISRYYQKNGYLTCHAYIPPQEVADGTIKIQIIESKVDGFIVKGNKWTKENYYKNILFGSDSFKKGKVFNAKELQIALKELNKKSYVKGQVKVNKTDGESTAIVLDVQDRMPISFDVIWDNYGRRLTGRQRANLVLGYDDLTGHGDRLYGGTILSTGTQGALAGYELPVGSKGTKIGFDYSYSNVHLGREQVINNTRGYSHNYSFRVTHPLYRSANTDVIWNTSFDALRTKTKLNTARSVISNYNLRVIRTGLFAMHDDAYGRWIGNLGADFGVGFLGATKNNPSTPYESDFVNFKSGVTRVHRLPNSSLAILRLDGQYSPNNLYASEQMQLGGPYTLRGYEPGVIIGDWGVSGTAEIRTPIPFITALLPKRLEHWEDKIRWTGFYDWGYVDEHNDIYGYPTNFLHNIGTGIHCYINDSMSASFNIGIPISNKDYNENDVRFNFAINSEVDNIFFKPKERL